MELDQVGWHMHAVSVLIVKAGEDPSVIGAFSVIIQL